jgi:hypothetical protein
MVRRHPAPGARSIAAPEYPLLVNLRDDIPITGQQGFGRAHFGTQRQLALREPVGSVFFELFDTATHFCATAARAERALVHLASGTEVSDARILGRAERTGVKAVATADTQILRVQHHAFLGGKDAAHRAHGGTWRVGAMHAGHRDRALARQAVIERHYPAPIDAPRHLVLVLACRNARVAIDAAICVAKKFHSRHGLYPARI